MKLTQTTQRILKRIACQFIAICIFSMMLLAYPMNVPVHAATGSGWSYENGILTITGSQGIGNYTKSNYSNRGWQAYASDIWSVKMNQGVTSIGTYSFCELPNLKQVAFPSTLIKISDGAFYHCSELSSVTVPEGVTQIGSEAFYNCSLGTICLPSTVRACSVSLHQVLKEV